MQYDIIGDIHGHAGELEALLVRMGYAVRGGAYRHPSRTAIFVGDFIDRGLEQLKTVGIVRRMVDAGSALAVMGNHEFNAIAWHTPSPRAPGDYLRSRFNATYGEKNREQHEKFLAAVEHDPALHREIVEWFLTLPLWLDLPDLRVVHACWHPAHMETLTPRLAPGNRLTLELLVDATLEGSPEFVAAECLTKGIEVALPNELSFRDKDGHERRNGRLRWWDTGATRYCDAILVPSETRALLPDTPIPEGLLPTDTSEKPTFVGHYWERGDRAPYSPRLACVDYSAGKGEPLVAYRWEGETTLRKEAFVASR